MSDGTLDLVASLGLYNQSEGNLTLFDNQSEGSLSLFDNQSEGSLSLYNDKGQGDSIATLFLASSRAR